MTAARKTIEKENAYKKNATKLKDEELRKTSGGIRPGTGRGKSIEQLSYDNPYDNTGNGSVFGGN